WRRGRVTVTGSRFGRPFRVEAERAIVTLPLGVLQQPRTAESAVHFIPPLKPKGTALRLLASGPALKVLLQFRMPFWAQIDNGRYRRAGFFQAPDAAFPTFWTPFPLRAPQLVAWAGGPRAQRLAHLDAPAIVHEALRSADALFGGCVDVADTLVAGYVHDWQRDPYARGAYSYAKVGGQGARRALAAPLLDTLFFAGEAADYEGETGRVAGA